jgi:hypothetical protein
MRKIKLGPFVPKRTSVVVCFQNSEAFRTLSSTFSQTIRYHQNEAFANGDHVWINSWGHPEV